MDITIKYTVDSVGQKAHLLAGKPASKEQQAIVPADSPHFLAALEQSKISSDGTSASIDLSILDHPSYDHVPTTEELLGHRARVEVAKMEKIEAEAAQRKARSLHRLAARETRTTSIQVYGDIRWTKIETWLYDGDKDYASDSDREWLTGIDAANAAAKAEAESKADEKRAADEAEKAAKDAARQAWREANGLEDGDIALKVEDGALASVPPGCWKTHTRGKNWLAVITVDPAKPGGLDRDFCQKAKGSSYYMVPAIEPGQAVEFGADYYSGGGRKSPTRWYGFFFKAIAQTEGRPAYMVFRGCPTGKAAVKAGEKFMAVGIKVS